MASIGEEVLPFDSRVSSEEVARAVATLRSQRAVGPGGVPGELVKCGGPAVAQQLALLYSHIVEQSETVLELKQGYLYLLSTKGCRPEGTGVLLSLPH